MKIIESGNFVPVFFECQQENQTDHSAAEDFAETDGQHLKRDWDIHSVAVEQDKRPIRHPTKSPGMAALVK